jgi:hypothetical protein
MLINYTDVPWWETFNEKCDSSKLDGKEEIHDVEG